MKYEYFGFLYVIALIFTYTMGFFSEKSFIVFIGTLTVVVIITTIIAWDYSNNQKQREKGE